MLNKPYVEPRPPKSWSFKHQYPKTCERFQIHRKYVLFYQEIYTVYAQKIMLIDHIYMTYFPNYKIQILAQNIFFHVVLYWN